jgi:type III secretion protein N (ATPase)
MIGRPLGSVVRAHGDLLAVSLPGARVGDGVRIVRRLGAPLTGHVVSVDRTEALVAPFGTPKGIAAGDRVERDSEALAVPLGCGILGRALDAFGSPLDGRPAPAGRRRPVFREAPAPHERAPASEPAWTGVAAVDSLLAFARGARLGIFGPPGAGKTTLLEGIVAGARADAVVVALVGERGREAQAWCARAGGRTTIVCATSDRSAPERIRAAEVALAQAAYLAARGAHVLLMIDSLARYAAALRERRVAGGETAGRGGYPPGVFGDLARYLEAAGSTERGSLTLVASVLSEGSDEYDPLSEAARSLVDGHIVLSPALARAGSFPAIDVLASTSRTFSLVASAEHRADAGAARAALALLAQTEDLRALGLADGSEPRLRAALCAERSLAALVHDPSPSAPRRTLARLAAAAAPLRAAGFGEPPA